MNRFWTRFAVFVLAGLLVVRAGTAWQVGDVPAWVWAYGFVADLAALLLLAGIVAIASLTRVAWLRTAAVALVVAVVLIVMVAEFFYWHEFESRLDRLVFHYLAYPVEVLTFLEEQFYVTWALLPFALLVAGLVMLLGPLPQGRARTVLPVLAAAILVVACVRQPVPDPSRRLNQLASNGYVGVLTAAFVREDDWDALYPGALYPDSLYPDSLYPDGGGTGPAPLSGAPENASTPRVQARHVVLIIEESFAGTTWLDPDIRESHLPSFTALSKEGLSFANIRASGTRTTRGMESILHGFPPLPGISATEREGFERLPSLARAFGAQGYMTVFAYGGWPDFSNFTGYWHRIGFARTTSRNDFPEGTFETSWGVSDRDLFTQVLAQMDELTQAKAPVFLATLTVSHHRPYIVPAGEPGSEERSSRAAMRYADAALGYFFAQARLRDWYEDTVFVVVADHGPRIQGDSLIPIESFRVPLLIISAPEIEPRVVIERGSSMGIAPTLMAMFGFATDEHFWSPSLLEGKDAPVPVEHDYHIGDLSGDRLTVLARGGAFHAWSVGEKGVHHLGRLAADSPDARRVATYFRHAHALLYPPG